MTDRAPTVYDADGNPLKVRLVGHECAGDVSGEGHYGYTDEENGAHRSLYFEEVEDDA